MRTKKAIRRGQLLLVAAVAAVASAASVANALVGPGSPGGVGYGAIASDSQNNVAVGSTTTLSTTKFTVTASSTSNSHYAFQVLQPGGTQIFWVRNDGTVSVPGTFSAGTFSTTISAANVSAATFGANAGNGNFQFPVNLGVGTTPSYGLDVYTTSSPMRVRDTAGRTYIQTSLRTGSYMTVHNISFGGDRLIVDTDGGEGGNSTILRRSINNMLIYEGDHTDYPGAFAIRQKGGSWVFWADQSTGGNIGIGGETSPAYLLTVGSGDLFGVNSSGYALAPAGAATTPSYSFTADTNTGMYSAGSDVLLFATGGSERIRVNSSGFVGIGTNNPGQMLHVNAAGIARFALTSGSTFMSFGADATDGPFYMWNSGAAALRYATASDTSGSGFSEKMRINSGGNVSIGNTNNTYKLEVTGTIFSSSGGFRFPDGTTQTTAATGGSTIAAPNVSSGAFGANTGGGNYSFPANVSAGSNPLSSGRLNLETSSTNPILTLRHATGDFGGESWAVTMPNGSGFVGNSSDILFSDSSGSVLRLGGTGSGSNKFEINGSNLTVDESTGYVGVGTASSYVDKLNVVASGSSRSRTRVVSGTGIAGVQFNTNGNDWYIDNRGANETPYNRLSIYDTSVERFTILQGGNVGIGQTNPGYKLEVAGTIYSSSGGFRFPDGTTQTTAAASTIGAANVSAGTFAGNTGGGNFVFPANLRTDTFTMNTNPGGYEFDVYNDAGGRMYLDTTPYPMLWLVGPGNNEGGMVWFRANGGSQGIGFVGALNDSVTLGAEGSGGSGGSVIFQAGGSQRMTIAADGTVSIGGGTGKLNVGTVDPIYEINGEKFATYMAGMIGVKEEVAGEMALPCRDGRCERTIVFADEPKGSDLWLFGKTTDIEKHLSQASIMLTPAFDGRVSYRKGEGALTIVATSFEPVDEVHVSYRFTAPRFDADKWGNATDDPTPGFVVE